MQNLEVGKIYEISHARKGRFTAKILSVQGDFCTAGILDGKASARLDYNVRLTGEEISMRISLIRAKPVDQAEQLEKQHAKD